MCECIRKQTERVSDGYFAQLNDLNQNIRTYKYFINRVLRIGYYRDNKMDVVAGEYSCFFNVFCFN